MGADVCITSRRPSDVTCGAAILDSRWRRRKWRQPRLGAAFSIPIVVVVENGDPSASGRHLGWPHLRNRKWGHPRWRPEAEGPPFFHHHYNGDRKGRPILLNINMCSVVSIVAVYPDDLHIRTTHLGWGLLSQFPPFRYFSNFSPLSKPSLYVKYRVYIWQVSPQLSCGDACQI